MNAPVSVLLLACLACLACVSAVNKPHPTDKKVLVELFVMSRCPDAQRAEARFNEILQRVHNITHVQLHFIADNAGQTVTCKHGDIECAGNRQQLCVYDKSPGAENYQSFWQFIMCQNAAPAEVGQLPLAERCLGQLSKSLADQARACMTGYEGEGLLRADAAIAPQRSVTRSCTIFINGEKRCIHDGGRWYDCPGGYEVDDFVASICEAFWTKTGEWPAVCGQDKLRAHMNEVVARQIHH